MTQPFHGDLLRAVAQTEKKLDIEFRNKTLLRRALTTHLSAYHGDKERLEFLGDAVLGFIVSEYLYRNQPVTMGEGSLTMLKTELVRNSFLAIVAKELGIPELLFCAQGCRYVPDWVAADTLEAIIGALYLDKGKAAAEEFVTKHIISKISRAKENTKQDYKGRLQKKARCNPEYRILEEQELHGRRTCRVGVYIAEWLVAEGSGRTKKEAEIEAARNALKSYGE